MAVTKSPPLIAPGILCPKCKGAMLDERQTKRSDKSPDYTCANMLCVQVGNNGKSYRTAIWAEKGNGSGAETSAGGEMGKPNTGTSASAPSVAPSSKKPTMREAYKQLTEWVISDIGPLYHDESFDSSVVAAITATLFIQACKSGKVE